MQKPAIHKPIKLNRDKNKKYIGQDEAYYLLNAERSTGGSGSNIFKTVPFNASKLLCAIDVPAAEDPTAEQEPVAYPIGSYNSPLTNEVYVFYYNPSGDHFILRVNDDKSCEIVYQGECLGFSADPKHAIENWRVYLKYDKFCAHRDGKQLIWTDGLNPIGQLDVEASIATDSFSTDFFQICPDECANVQMCVPEPCGIPQGEFVALEQEDVDLKNHLLDVGIQLRYRHVYYDQRASEWSDISSLFFQDASCFDAGAGLSRCIKFRIPVGNPMVERIEIAFRSNNQPQWYLSDVVEKYQPYTSEDQKWYERELADLDGFSDEDCAFDYTFCNDKQCAPIDVNQTNRVFNPIPREAQALFPIKDALGFLNYKKGNCPLVETETKKFEVSVDCETDACAPDLVSVVFYAVIHEFAHNRNGLILRNGGLPGIGQADNKDDTAFWGALPGNDGLREAYQQYFTGDTRNFIAYIEGTDYSVEMEQWIASNGMVNLKEAGVYGGMEFATNRTGINIAIENGNIFFVQKGVFKVPRGTKGFIRLVNHKEKTGVGSAQDTSTFVAGYIPDIHDYNSKKDVQAIIQNGEELYFNTCDLEGNTLELDNALVIADQDIDNEQDAHSSRSFGGYVTDSNGLPVENAQVWADGTLYGYTDHNGFYHFVIWGDGEASDTFPIEIKVEQNAGFTTVRTLNVQAGYGYNQYDVPLVDSDTPDGFAENFFERVSVIVTDCDSNVVSGVRVAVSGSKYKITDDAGEAVFKIRNNGTTERTITAVIMDKNGCFTSTCEDVCNQCMPTATLTIGSDLQDAPYTDLAMFPMNTNIGSVSKRGLKNGGRYPVGIVAQGDCGRLSAVYPITVLTGSIPADGSFLDIPKTQQKGVFNFCRIAYDATGMKLPLWATCLKFVRGNNMNGYTLQWVVDKAERRSDGKMVLTIQSLNDYNALYNFKTNTTYDYAPGDRVEFINNGNGEIFDADTYGVLNFQVLSPFADLVLAGEENPPADFFNQILIQANDALNSLSDEDLIGAKIELQRPKECTVEHEAFFEVASLPLVESGGFKVLEQPTGEIITFDTYAVNRKIEGFSAQFFEHMNPSDFWGDEINGISDIGKPHFINRYENEKRWGRNISINTPGQFNRFGDLEKTLDAPEQGDLIAIGIYDGKVGVGIGEFDNFPFQISDEFLRLGSDGVVRAAPADAIISDTEPKVQGKFGCQYDDIGSIIFGDGWITWVDTSKGAYVKHDFSVAKDISENAMQSYFRKKWHIMKAFNSTATSDIDKYRFITGFNYHTNAIQLTMKKLSGVEFHNEQDALISESETILIEPRTEEFLTFSSYAPDRYSNITINDSEGCMFLSFFRASSWIHTVVASRYNEFFGKQADRVVTISVNQEPEIIKRFVGLEVQDEKMWFVSKVLVDNPSFESEIPPAKFVKKENKWNAGFLCDKNSRGGLYATGDVVGIKPRGYYALVTFVRDNTDNLKYGTIDPDKRVLYDELDMLIVKYFYSAQSGMKENL